MGLKSLRVATRRDTYCEVKNSGNAVLDTAFLASLRNAYSN